MDAQARASTAAGAAAPAAAPAKKKKTGTKETKPPATGDTLAGAVGHDSNALFTALHVDPLAFDAAAVKEVRNFLLAPSHAAYLNRPWSTNRTLTEEEVSNPPSIVPLLYRDTTVNRRPVLAMLDDTYLTYVIYGNGYRSLEKNHVLYELCETHGKAIVLGLCAYFGQLEEDKLDFQYRYMIASLLDLYGDLKWTTTSGIYSGPPLDRKVRVLVVDGLARHTKEYLKTRSDLTDPGGVAPGSTPLQSLVRYKTYIDLLASMSQWAAEPRGADGHARARRTCVPQANAPAAAAADPPAAPAAPADEADEAEADEAEADEPARKRSKQKKRKRDSSSDEEDEMSDSGSDVRSESSEEEEDESSNSGSETEDEDNSSDSDDEPVSKRAESMKAESMKAKPSAAAGKPVPVAPAAPAAPVAPAAPAASGQPTRAEKHDKHDKHDKPHKRPGPKPKDPSEKKKPDNAGSLRKQVTDKLDRILEMHCLFENSLPKDLGREVTSTIDKVKSISRDYMQEGKVENARAFIDAQSDLARVLMKALASVCHGNDGSGNTAHRKLAVVMATLYESESSQFESIAQAMVSMGAQMEAMVKNRAAAGEEAAAAAADLAELVK